MTTKYYATVFIAFFSVFNYGAISADRYGVEEQNSMRIVFMTEGGIAYFPGLSKPVTINVEQLTEVEARELRQLVEAANFFNLPSHGDKPAPGAADYKKYKITVEAGEQQHTVHLTDPIEDRDLQNLIKFLTTKAKEQRIHERKNDINK